MESFGLCLLGFEGFSPAAGFVLEVGAAPGEDGLGVLLGMDHAGAVGSVSGDVEQFLVGDAGSGLLLVLITDGEVNDWGL